MKRLKFKKPFNGMDNAKKLIPESYKVDGNEFEITDGNETYRVKWSSLINEGIVLTSSNKSKINEDMQKMKHLMGFKSQDTLGTVKGAARLDENKKFGDILGKTKNLLNESEETMGGPIPSDPYQADKNHNDKLISQVKSKFGLDDLIFTITVDKPEQEYRGGNGTLYVYAEKGGDSIEFQFDVEADLDYEGEPQDLYIEKEKSKYPNDYPEYVKFITQFITPEAYKELEENIDIEFDGLNEGEKKLTPAQKKHIDLNNDGDIDKKDFEIMHQLNDLDKEAEKKKENNETHIKEEEEESGALSQSAIGKELKNMGSTISQADFENAKERGVVTRLLDIVKKLAKESNGYSPGVKMKLDYLEKEINDAIASGGAAEGDESSEERRGFNNEEATFTPKYDKHPKLKGKQHTLPDEIQADIVGVDEANKISPKNIRSGGMGGNLESNPYNNKEVKGRAQGKALRQADKEEIEKQLADMEPKDRFEEVFEGIYENVSEDVVEKFLKDFSNPETVKQVEEITKGYLIPYLEDAAEAHEYSDGPGEGGGIDWKLSYELDMDEFDVEINNSSYSFLPELKHGKSSYGINYWVDSVTVNEIYLYDGDSEIELNASVDARVSKVLDNIALIIKKVYEHYTQDDVLSKIYSDQGGFDNYRDDYERYGVSRSDFT